MSIFLFLTFIHEGFWRCHETSQQTSTSPGPIIHRPGAGLLQQGIEVWLFLVRVFAVVVLFFLLMLKVFVFRWTTVYSWDQWRPSPQSLRWQVRGSFHIPLLKLLLLLLMFLLQPDDGADDFLWSEFSPSLRKLPAVTLSDSEEEEGEHVEEKPETKRV